MNSSIHLQPQVTLLCFNNIVKKPLASMNVGTMPNRIIFFFQRIAQFQHGLTCFTHLEHIFTLLISYYYFRDSIIVPRSLKVHFSPCVVLFFISVAHYVPMHCFLAGHGQSIISFCQRKQPKEVCFCSSKFYGKGQCPYSLSFIFMSITNKMLRYQRLYHSYFLC